MADDLVERLRVYHRFLNGETAINEAWFGDVADGERGRFWWRKYLRINEAADAIETLRAENARLTEENERLREALENAIQDLRDMPLSNMGGRLLRWNKWTLERLRAALSSIMKQSDGR